MTSEKLTQRQKQSEQASKAKARRKRNHARTLKLKIAAGVGAALLTLAIGVLSYTGTLTRMADQAVARFDAATIKRGFAVQTIFLDGNSRTPQLAVEQALQIPKGAPILTVSLSAARERLEAIPTVKTAVVERALPNTLHIRIVEREPIAIWQYKQKQALLDDTGAIMKDLDVSNYAHLPLFIGEGVPEHIQEGMELLAESNALRRRIHCITRVGDRRWDVTLTTGITIRLPEANHFAALRTLQQLDQETQLTERAIKVIDMRDSTRLILQRSLTPSAPSHIAAQET